MKFILLISLALTTSTVIGSDKFTVTLSERGHSSSGGKDRETEIEIKLSNGLGNGPMSTTDKVKALQKHVRFYQLMDSKKIDLSKPITAAYAEKPLSEILKELIPNIVIKFNGVDPKVTVESMAITQAPLEKVLMYLDKASGVYFSYSDKGLLVSAKPNQ